MRPSSGVMGDYQDCFFESGDFGNIMIIKTLTAEVNIQNDL